METIKLLKQLKHENKITTQSYKTYMGPTSSGDELACIQAMKTKQSTTNEKAAGTIDG